MNAKEMRICLMWDSLKALLSPRPKNVLVLRYGGADECWTSLHCSFGSHKPLGRIYAVSEGGDERAIAQAYAKIGGGKKLLAKTRAESKNWIAKWETLKELVIFNYGWLIDLRYEKKAIPGENKWRDAFKVILYSSDPPKPKKRYKMTGEVIGYGATEIAAVSQAIIAARNGQIRSGDPFA
jgi:hypothetical protein